MARLAAKIRAYEHLLSPDMVKQMLEEVGRQMKPEVLAGVARTPVKNPKRSLRDGSMSGWGKRDGTPFVLTGRYEQPAWHEVDVLPIKPATGPMRVLEGGRQAYKAGDQRVKGTYRSKKTGEVRSRYRKVKRDVGAQAGKGTWTDITGVVAKKGPALYSALRVRAIDKILSRG